MVGLPPFDPSVARGVGQCCKAPPPVTPVRCSNFRSGYNCPTAVIPDLGQLPDHGSAVPVSKDAWHVLQHDDAGSHVADDSERVRPEVPFVTGPKSGSGDAMGLTRESRSDDVHQSGQWSEIGASDVSDDGRPIEQTVTYPGLQDSLAVVIYFHVADAADAQTGEAQPQAEPLVAAEQGQVVQDFAIHDRPLRSASIRLAVRPVFSTSC